MLFALKKRRKVSDDELLENYIDNYLQKNSIERQLEAQKLKEETKQLLAKDEKRKDAFIVLLALAGIALELKKEKNRERYEEKKERYLENTARWFSPSRPSFKMLSLFNNDFRAVNFEGIRECLEEKFFRYYPYL